MGYWDSIADRSGGQFTSDDFEAAAYRIVVEQVIYYSDRHSRTAYWALSDYESDFKKALAPLGITININKKLKYVYAVPQHTKAGAATVAQTVLALVLRMIYDEDARVGKLNDDGEVICYLDVLADKHLELSGRELPMRGKLDALLEIMKRWGIARKSEDYPMDASEDSSLHPYVIIIRPAIVDILGETVLQHLSRFKAAATDAEDESIRDSEPAEQDMEA